jgi:hypothetical protein
MLTTNHEEKSRLEARRTADIEDVFSYPFIGIIPVFIGDSGRWRELSAARGSKRVPPPRAKRSRSRLPQVLYGLCVYANVRNTYFQDSLCCVSGGASNRVPRGRGTGSEAR